MFPAAAKHRASKREEEEENQSHGGFNQMLGRRLLSTGGKSFCNSAGK